MTTTPDDQNGTSTGDIPANANEGCVGPTSEAAGKASACEGCPNAAACSSGAFRSDAAIAAAQAQAQALRTSLECVSHVILVLSGKGGVGKSTVAAQLSMTLASRGYAVGLLDVDLCGPSAPRMVLGDKAASTIHQTGSGAWIPVYASPNLAVMSISFLLGQGGAQQDQAVVWRGPRKNALIEQFFSQVDWTGDTNGLDYLIVDTPPGTSDEHISTVQFLQKARTAAAPEGPVGQEDSSLFSLGALVVTTPEEVSLADVRKEINFCQKTKLPVLGVMENMSSYEVSTPSRLQFLAGNEDCTERILTTLQSQCPDLYSKLSVRLPLFPASRGGGEAMAKEFGLPFWGRLPLDPDLQQACEQGRCFVGLDSNNNDDKQDQAAATASSTAARALEHIVELITKTLPVDMAD